MKCEKCNGDFEPIEINFDGLCRNCRKLKDNNGWIKVEDRLPKQGTEVLVLVRYDTRLVEMPAIEISRIVKGKWRLGLMFIHGQVTHWMPLPKLPKEK